MESSAGFNKALFFSILFNASASAGAAVGSANSPLVAVGGESNGYFCGDFSLKIRIRYYFLYPNVSFIL